MKYKLTTDKQVAYLTKLADKVERMKKTTRALQNVEHMDWYEARRQGMDTLDASIRINAYHQMITWANVTRKLLGLKQL